MMIINIVFKYIFRVYPLVLLSGTGIVLVVLGL